MNDQEKLTWKAENYKDLLNELLMSYKVLGLKIHILEIFTANLGTVSDERGKRFSLTEKRYQGKCSPGMLVNFCWKLKRNLPGSK